MDETKTMEILKTAILLERRGKAFYAKVANQSSDPDVKQVFEIMADEEEEHIRILSEQFTHYAKHQKLKDVELPKELGSIPADVLTAKVKDNISAASYEAAAISSAIDMEKRAIAVYSDRAKQTDDPQEKKLFQWLADWEQGHFDILFELDRDLKEKIWFDNHFWPS